MIAAGRDYTRADLEAEARACEDSDPELADAIRAVLDTGSPVAWLALLTFTA